MKPVHFYTIMSCGGLKVEVSNLGAKITKLIPSPLSRQGKDIGLLMSSSGLERRTNG